MWLAEHVRWWLLSPSKPVPKHRHHFPLVGLPEVGVHAAHELGPRLCEL